MKKRTIIYDFCLTVIISVIFCSCFYFHTDVRPLNKDKVYQAEVYKIRNPIKAHLIDGSLIVFPNGFRMENNILIGNGIKYDLYRRAIPFKILPLDSISKIIYYEKTISKSINVEDFEGNITLPTRLQLIDNSLVIASQGIDREGNKILCRSDELGSQVSLPLEDVAVLEYYKRKWQPVPTIASIPAFVPAIIWFLIVILSDSDRSIHFFQ